MNSRMIALSDVEEKRDVITRGVVGGVALLCLATVSASAQSVQSLSLKDAEQRAVQNHPQIRAVQYAAMAADESVHQVRSAYFPTVYGSVTGAEAESGSRIAAGGLNNPIILDRFAAGLSIGQLITDFGRTHDLVESFGLRADAQRQDVDGRRADVLLQVDRRQAPRPPGLVSDRCRRSHSRRSMRGRWSSTR